MADIAKKWLTCFGRIGHKAYMLKTWRIQSGKSQGECAMALGMRGGARTFQRIESGESSADADMVERISAMTGGEVSAVDMHETRLSWLKTNRPEKFDGEVAA